jgi:hypothetical protein
MPPGWDSDLTISDGPEIVAKEGPESTAHRTQVLRRGLCQLQLRALEQLRNKLSPTAAQPNTVSRWDLSSDCGRCSLGRCSDCRHNPTITAVTHDEFEGANGAP